MSTPELHTPDSTYNSELAAARLAALRALTEILTTTDDPAEKRRVATTILKLPQSTPEPSARKIYLQPPPPLTRYEDDLALTPKPTPLQSLESAVRAIVATDDATFRQVVCNPNIPLPDLSPARLARICGSAGSTGPPK